MELQRYTQEERAPSLAEEFKRVAEEKAKADHAENDQVAASQTSDKAGDATQEAVKSDSNLQDVKSKYEEHEAGSDYRKRGD